MRHCHHRQCGSPLPSVARFCPRCGRRARRGGLAWAAVTVLCVGGLLLFTFAGMPPMSQPATVTPGIDVHETLPRTRQSGLPFSTTPMHP